MSCENNYVIVKVKVCAFKHGNKTENLLFDVRKEWCCQRCIPVNMLGILKYSDRSYELPASSSGEQSVFYFNINNSVESPSEVFTFCEWLMCSRSPECKHRRIVRSKSNICEPVSIWLCVDSAVVLHRIYLSWARVEALSPRATFTTTQCPRHMRYAEHNTYVYARSY